MVTPAVNAVLSRGVYGASEALRLINFRRQYEASPGSISRQTVARWLRGYEYSRKGVTPHSDPLWEPDYVNDDDTIELSFRDLIELRFVKAFRDVGLSLPTIRECHSCRGSSKGPTAIFDSKIPDRWKDDLLRDHTRRSRR